MRFYTLPEALNSDIRKYEELVKGYKEDTIDKVKLKSFRVPMGIYEQREADTYMCRVRLPGGAITPLQLVEVAKIAEKYSDRPLHFTTRSEVQIHHVKLEDTIFILKDLKRLGLATRGGGGNTVRNIIGSSFSGIDEDEVFDISPYVQALTTRMIAESDSWELPRKFKIAFSNNPRDTGLATANDLGFIAKINEKGEKGFIVYIAGGLGAKPRIASLLYDFIPEEEVYNITKAAKNLFDKYGNRKNKHAARLRFLFNQLGREEFVRRFEEELKKVKEYNYKPLEMKTESSMKKGFLEIPLLLGDLDIEKAKMLGNVLKGYGDDIVRVTKEQNILLRNLDAKDVPAIKKKLENSEITVLFVPIIGNAVACAGASTCRLGICLSRGLLLAIKDKLDEEQLAPFKISDISLKISGCPNSCGQHHIADIGFFGVVKRVEEHYVPCYTVVAGGLVSEGKTKIAEKIGILPAKNIPDYMAEFLKIVQTTRNDEESFSDYYTRCGKDKLLGLIDQYSDVPSFNKDKNFYYDWTSKELFSAVSKLEGECSAGLFDLIEWDFSNMDKAFAELKNAGDTQKILRNIVLYASRALLVTKGLEPKTELDAVGLFKEHFVGKHLDKSFLGIIDKYINKKSITETEASNLSVAVKELYDKMDNSLRFPELSKEKTISVESLKQEKHRQLFRDFRGVACPMNFVKTKLVLETMTKGEKLEVYLDNGEPIENVPASVKAEGHEIMEQKKIDNYWSVIIEKK